MGSNHGQDSAYVIIINMIGEELRILAFGKREEHEKIRVRLTRVEAFFDVLRRLPLDDIQRKDLISLLEALYLIPTTIDSVADLLVQRQQELIDKLAKELNL